MGTTREQTGNKSGNKTRIREQFGWEQPSKTGGNSSRRVPALVPAIIRYCIKQNSQVGTDFRVLIVTSPHTPLRADAKERPARGWWEHSLCTRVSSSRF